MPPYGQPPYVQYQPPPIVPLQPPNFTAVSPTEVDVIASSSRQRIWRHRKSAKEDQERLEKGEPPKKRYKKSSEYSYNCKLCRERKCVETGHTQVKGIGWYCPYLNISVAEWKEQSKK